MTDYKESEEKLFQTPQLEPKFRIWAYQWPGIFILLLIPILALFGVFGKNTKKITQSEGGIELLIQYPDKLRYGQRDSLSVKVTNASDSVLKNVVADFNSDYINQFSSVRFIPDPKEAYRVEIGDIAPGESHLVSVELEAEEYGLHQGEVSMTSAGLDLLTYDISTVVFP